MTEAVTHPTLIMTSTLHDLALSGEYRGATLYMAGRIWDDMTSQKRLGALKLHLVYIAEIEGIDLEGQGAAHSAVRVAARELLRHPPPSE